MQLKVFGKLFALSGLWFIQCKKVRFAAVWLQHCVVLYVYTNVSDGLVASIFRVEEEPRGYSEVI